MGISRRVATNLLATMWMGERDALNNTMMKIAGGFHPPTVLADARYQLHNISQIVQYADRIAIKPKDDIVALDYWDLKSKLQLK